MAQTTTPERPAQAGGADWRSDRPVGRARHSTHLRGAAGTYDETTGEERLRVTVTLATGIPEDRVRRVNLDYLDPAEVDSEAWTTDPQTMVVPHAGKDLFRLRDQRP